MRQTLFYIVTTTKQIRVKSIIYFLHTSNYWFIGLKKHHFALFTFYGGNKELPQYGGENNFFPMEKDKFPQLVNKEFP